jgi:hypothetical protein
MDHYVAANMDCGCWYGRWHDCWCGCLRGWHIAACMDDTWQPAWMTRGSLHGWWHVAAYMDDMTWQPTWTTMTWQPTWTMMTWQPTLPQPSSDYYSNPQGPFHNYNYSIKLAKNPITTSS